MAGSIGPTGFLARWALALVLVLGTYNPTGFSFVGWAFGEGAEFGPSVLIVGLILLIGWIFVVKTTFDAIGWLGVALGGALFAAIIWFFIDLGWLSLESEGIVSWLILIVISLILAAGMSWSYLKRSLTGQYNVDDVDD